MYLSKAALADDLEDLVAVGDVVVWNVDVGSLIVIVAAVIGPAHDPRPLLGTGTDEVHCGETRRLDQIKRFSFLVKWRDGWWSTHPPGR